MSNDRPYKPRPSPQAPVVLFHADIGLKELVHPIVHRYPLVDSLLKSSLGQEGASVFIADLQAAVMSLSSHDVTPTSIGFGQITKQLVKWFQKFNPSDAILVAEGSFQTALALYVAKAVGLTRAIVAVDADVPNLPLPKDVEIHVVGNSVAAWQSAFPAAKASASVDAALQSLFGLEARTEDIPSRFHVSVDFTLDGGTKQLKQVVTKINQEIEYQLEQEKNAAENPEPIVATPKKDAKKDTAAAKGTKVTKTMLLQTLRGGSVFHKLVVEVHMASMTMKGSPLKRCVVGDASGVIDCLSPIAFTKGQVVTLSGRCASVAGKLAIIAESSSPGVHKVEGYEPQIVMKHPNNLSAPKRSFGLLLLRGGKCVLCRSPEGEWDGVRIPYLPGKNEETPEETACRAAMTLCDIYDEEYYITPNVPSVTFHRPGEVITIFCGFATRPPPQDAPDEDFEESEDEDDLYDWFTFNQAFSKLKTPNERLALVQAAQALHVAVEANVMSLFGSVFGIECADWTPAQSRGIQPAASSSSGSRPCGSSGSKPCGSSCSRPSDDNSPEPRASSSSTGVPK